MKELFWDLFRRSGNIDAFMAYREYVEKEYESRGSIDVKKDYNGEFNG